jgi:hypothetical protein
MATKLVGEDEQDGLTGYSPVFGLSKHQAVASGDMTEFKVRCRAACNFKYAIYADNSGSPGALIAAVNTSTPMSPGWNAFSFPSTAITSGTYYWLAVCFDTASGVAYLSSGGLGIKYKAVTYSTFTFPDPAGSGFTNLGGYSQVVAGWESMIAKISSDTGSGIDAYVSLETPGAKLSSDVGSGLEGTPLPSASLTGTETGAGVEALTARLLASFDTGSSIEAAQLVGLLQELYASERGEGLDLLTAEIEMPTKGGGMKLWT